MTDKDYYIPDKSDDDDFTEEMWDNLKEVINATKAQRNLLFFSAGDLTYNGTTLSWGALLYVLFHTQTDAYIHNQIASSTLAVTSGQVVYCKTNDTNAATITLSATAYGSFDRAGTLANDSADVVILGYCLSGVFYPVHASLSPLGKLPMPASGLEHTNLVSISEVPSWEVKVPGFRKNEIYFYEDFTSYSNGDKLHNARSDDTIKVFDSNHYAIADTTQSKFGGIAGRIWSGPAGDGSNRFGIKLNFPVPAFGAQMLYYEQYVRWDSLGSTQYYTINCIRYNMDAANPYEHLIADAAIYTMRKDASHVLAYYTGTAYESMGVTVTTNKWYKFQIWMNFTRLEKAKFVFKITPEGDATVRYPTSGWKDGDTRYWDTGDFPYRIWGWRFSCFAFQNSFWIDGILFRSEAYDYAP